MKKYLFLAFSILLIGKIAFGQKVAPISKIQKDSGRIMLPNGWALSPAGHNTLPLGDLPLNIAVSPSRKMLAVTNDGESTQSIDLIDVQSEQVLDTIIIPKAWVGLQFSDDGKLLYASGANDNMIRIYAINNDQLKQKDSIMVGRPWPKNRIGLAGIAVDDQHHLLYAVTKEDSSLYVLDIRQKKIRKRIPLGAEAYTCLLSPDHDKLYISLWGGAKILEYDAGEKSITDSITTESHPNDMAITKDGKILYVANANSNSVSVIDLTKNKVLENISCALYPNAPAGSTTNSVALSTDEKTLYIANADNNCLAVFDVSNPGESHSKGFIPTGWYPTCVRVIGNQLFVANGKGFTSMANPYGPDPLGKKDNSSYQQGVKEQHKVQYIGGLFKGTLSIINIPTDKQLADYSQAVYRNTPFTAAKEMDAAGEPGNPIPRKVGDASPIKYVFYIIKENRTYDQMLGDMKEANGDSSLCIFGEKVTPNHHALAREFVLLDNFYVDAEVSADGHNWSMAAYANDYVEKTWPTYYGGRGGTYDYEGSRKIAYPDKGFIWNDCQRNNVSYRSYGEFGKYDKTDLPVLKGHMAPRSPSFNLSIKDVYREKVWEMDFDSLLAINKLPQFSTIRLPDDHTSGQRKGAYTPIAAVADNDLALGKLVQHISESPIWKESAIFVLEDDAQDGPDHVDAHRSPCLVISPYTKRHTVIHNMYSTSGVLRTMELILGLPPMSQYDAAAQPLWYCFDQYPDLKPYQARAAEVNINARNVAWNKSAKESAKMDLAREDDIPEIEFNEIIWKSVKGENAVMPAPRHSAFVTVHSNDKKDDDD